MSIKIQPLDNRVVVELLEAESRTPGGILIPDVAKERPVRGRVLAVGPGKWHPNRGGTFEDVYVDVGSVALFSKFAGDEIELDGKKLRIMPESEILAVLPE